MKSGSQLAEAIDIGCLEFDSQAGIFKKRVRVDLDRAGQFQRFFPSQESVDQPAKVLDSCRR